jgi:hypothetical protein
MNDAERLPHRRDWLIAEVGSYPNQSASAGYWWPSALDTVRPQHAPLGRKRACWFHKMILPPGVKRLRLS